jgi:hypothetical protein
MTGWLVAAGVLLLAGAAAAVAGYRGLVCGALTLDTGWGRRVRPLGPLTVPVAAARQQVYDLLIQPYLGRPTRALQEKVQVLERGGDMVLAAHRTPVGRRLVAVTVETVRFTPPERIDFRLLRGPVPHVVEYFELVAEPGGTTRVEYRGELGTDGWAAGAWWGRLVARSWMAAVRASLAAVKAEAERRPAGRGSLPPSE